MEWIYKYFFNLVFKRGFIYLFFRLLFFLGFSGYIIGVFFLVNGFYMICL